MSVSLSNIARPSGTRMSGAFLRMLNAGWQRIVRYCARHAAIADLRELDDERLQDIGLARSQIEAAAYGFVTNRVQK